MLFHYRVAQDRGQIMDAVLSNQASSHATRKNNRTSQKTVLIVDESQETRDVLTAALERRGVRILTTAVMRRGIAITKEEKPDLVIVDVDSVSTNSPQQTLDSFTHNASDETQIMAIGSAKFTAPIGESRFITKPYHFAPLLVKIENFLQQKSNG